MIRLLKSTIYPSFSPGLAGNLVTPTVTRSGATATRVNEEGLVAMCPANTPRLDYDPVTKACKGLLIEEQRANFVLQSQNFIVTWVVAGTPTTVSAAITQGFLTLDLIGDDSSSTLEGYTQTVTFTGNAVKALSVFMKFGTSQSSVFQLRDTSAAANRLLATISWTAAGVPSVVMTTGTILGTDDFGNGIYRFRFQSTSVTAANTNSVQLYPASDAAGATSNMGSTYFGGVQAENAELPSSYIPTTTATVTRNADDINATLISSWFNTLEGSIVATAAYDYPGVSTTTVGLCALNDNTSSEEYRFQIDTNPGTPTYIVRDGGVSQASLTGATISAGVPVTLAGCYKVNDFALSVQGAAVTTDASGALPTITRLRLGSIGAGTTFLNGWLRGFSYYGKRLSNGDLQTLSAGGVITTPAIFAMDFTGAALQAQTDVLTKPRITYQDHCRGLLASAVTASTEVSDFPRDAPLRPETWESWKMSAVPATWRVNLGSQKAFSYVLIVATPGATASLEWSNDDSTFFWLGGPLTLTGPADLFLFPSVTAQFVRVTIDGTIVPVQVIKVGPALTVAQHVAPGLKPLNLSRDTDLATSRSPSGHLLGSTIRKRGFKSGVNFHHFSSAWYRANFDPFVADARLWPFGFAWNPQDAPTDVAYCWLEGDPDISPAFSDIPMLDVSFNMVGFDG